jgi:type IV pilus assembly protein PilC
MAYRSILLSPPYSAHAAKSDLTERGTTIAEFYESEVHATVKALTTIIEPLMIVVVGGTFGGIIVAMYLPMFKIVELID